MERLKRAMARLFDNQHTAREQAEKPSESEKSNIEPVAASREAHQDVPPEEPQLAQQVAHEDPQDQEKVLSVLERWAKTSTRRLSVADMESCRWAVAKVLEHAYRGSAQWARLAQLWETLLLCPVPTMSRESLFSDLLDIYELKLKEPSMAFGVAARGFAEFPQDAFWEAKLEELAQNGQKFEELVCLYLDGAERKDNAHLEVGLRKRAAILFESRLDDREQAIVQWEILLARDPSDREVLGALERLYRLEGNVARLEGILRGALLWTEDPEAKKDLLFEISECLARPGADVDARAQIFWSILELDPENLQAMNSLDELFSEQELWSDLALVLEREISWHRQQAELSEPRILHAMLLRMADLQLNRLANKEAAMAYLRFAVEAEEGSEETIGLLESFLQDPARKLFAAQSLEPIFRKANHAQKLVPVLEILLAEEQEPGARRSRFLELVSLHDLALDQKSIAFLTACRAFTEGIRDDEFLHMLEKLAEKSDLMEELEGLYEEWLEDSSEPALQRQILRKLAYLRECLTQNKDQAVALWKRLLESDPQDKEALAALQRLYRDQECYQELADVVLRLIKLEENDERKKDLYYELAHLQEEKLGLAKEAIDTYLTILSLDPQDISALKLLNRLYIFGAKPVAIPVAS